MTRHRSSDLQPAIPDDNAPVPPAKRPTWWRVRRVRAIAFTCLGLAVALSLLSALLSWRAAQVSYEQAQTSAAQAEAVNQRLQVLERDLAERREQRDAERDQFSARLCELLGQLPDDAPTLDRLRATLACTQPGLTPGAIASLEDDVDAADPAAAPGPSPAVADPTGSPATVGPAPPAASRSTEPSPTTAPTPAASGTTTPAPASSTPGPQPADGLLCTVLPIICRGAP